MTKEELERIKQAYNSGLKVQIWFNGHWENFDARDYAMYSDPFSENRQYRIIGSAYADIAEKRIAELEKENAETLKAIRRIAIDASNFFTDNFEPVNEKEESKRKFKIEQLTEAKEIIKDLLDTQYQLDPYLDVFKARIKRAEDFISGVNEDIQGENNAF